MPPGQPGFNDFRIFFIAARGVHGGEALYRTDRPDFFEPGSAVYKYPPPWAGVVYYFAKMPRWKPVARGLYCANLSLLALTLGLLLTVFRFTLRRKLLLVLVFLGWQPFHESLAGLQLEPTMIGFVALGYGIHRKSQSRNAVAFAIGMAAALKVYPVVLGLFYVLRRDWRGLAAMSGGGLSLLALSVIPLTAADSWHYFTRVLPELGGTSLGAYNMGLFAGIARAILRIAVDADVFAQLASVRVSSVMESSGIGWLTLLSKSLFFPISLLLIWTTFRLIQRARKHQQTGDVGFFCSVCLLVLLIPTSWVDYQTWLVLPAAYLIHRANSWQAWALLAAGVLPGMTINSLDGYYIDHQWVFWFARAIIPVALWAGLLVTVWKSPVLPDSSKGIL